MKRRDFLTATALTGGAWVGLEAGQSAVEQRERKTPLPRLDKSAYYEFSPDNKECIIHRHDTPVAWMNLLGNGRLVAWIAHNGVIVDSYLIHNRINRLSNAGSGRLYIRDAETRGHFLLDDPMPSAPWQAVQGLGYNRVSTTALGWTVSATRFVARDDDVIVSIIAIRNDRNEERSVDVFSLVEWSLGDMDYSTLFPGGDFYGLHNNFKKVAFDDGILYANNNCWGALERFQGQRAWPYTGFLTASAPVKSFECDRTRFLGRTGTPDNPGAVQRGTCSSKAGFGFTDFPLGVLHNAFRVPSKDEAKFVVLLGLVRERQQVPHLREKYHSVAAAEQALSNVKTFWRQYTETSVLVQTPEPEIDRLVNIWIKYQHRASMLQNLNTGRTGSGIWSPAYPCGMGRDSDIRETANVPCDNEIVKENLFDFLEGGPLLLKSDLTPKWGSPTIFKSDLEMRWTATPLPYPSDGRSLWPYSVCWHVRETGDFSVLETAIPYRGQHRWAPASGSGTLFEAMKLAIEDALSGLSARGLPRMNPGLGDWNDGLNLLSRTGKAESVMTAMELCFMLRECAELAQAYNRAGEASAWMQQYASIKAAINQHAWDGRWYVRAFNDEGEPIGSSRNRDGRIFLEPQAWAVLSGVATPERAAMCLESVDELLMTDYGPRLLVPPYSQPDDHVGIIADYGPGWRENGAIWNRPTGWAVMANCLADRAAAAYEMYRRASIHHPSRNENIDRFWLPPYAYPEFLVGAGPEFGRGQFQWCIGKAGTMWRAYVYYILGVRPVFAGLLVDPKIPNEWPGFKLRRTFRGATYAIEVANPKGVNFGVQSMEVDGKPIEGNVVPAYADGKTHEVNVVLGA